MKKPLGSLFVVAATLAATPAFAERPRVLRTGSPACGNVLSEKKQATKSGGMTEARREQADERRSRELAAALDVLDQHERQAIIRPRVLATGSPACGNVVKAETGAFDRSGMCTPEETVLALELRSRFDGHRLPTRAELDLVKQARAAKWSVRARVAAKR